MKAATIATHSSSADLERLPRFCPPPSERDAWSLQDLEAVGIGTRSTIWRLQRCDPTFPKPIAIRGIKRWLPDEIRAWLKAQPRVPLGDQAA